jgi:type IV pilus assembly protein PilO
VTLHNLSISPVTTRDAKEPSTGLLAMEATARTYRYLDPAEVAEQRRAAAEKNKGPRK